MAGQSWTKHNTGKKIMFGGVYPTIMSFDGASSPYADPNAPPYQTKADRLIYKSIESPVILQNHYAGGYHDNNSGYVDPGGYWHNGSRAISWTEKTLFVAGKYCNTWNMSGNIDIFAGYDIEAACMPSATAIVVIIHKPRMQVGDVGPKRMLVKLSVSSNPPPGDQFFANLNGALILDPTPTGGHTGFDKSCKRTAYLDTVGRALYIRTFGDTYDSFSDQQVWMYSAPSSATVTSTSTVQTEPPPSTIWTANSNQSSSFTPGGPDYDRAFMLRDSIVVAGFQITNYTSTGSGTATKYSGSSSSTNQNFNFKLVTKKIDFLGNVSDFWESPVLTASSSSSHTYNYDPANLTKYTYDDTNMNTNLLVFEDSVVFSLYRWVVDESLSASSVEGAASAAVTTTGSRPEPLDVWLRQTKVIDDNWTRSTNSSGTSTTIFNSYQNTVTSETPDPSSITVNVTFPVSWFSIHGAVGSKLGMVVFDKGETSFYDETAYTLLFDLQDPLSYSVTEGPVNPVGSNVTSQVGVTTT